MLNCVINMIRLFYGPWERRRVPVGDFFCPPLFGVLYFSCPGTLRFHCVSSCPSRVTSLQPSNRHPLPPPTHRRGHSFFLRSLSIAATNWVLGWGNVK